MCTPHNLKNINNIETSKYFVKIVIIKLKENCQSMILKLMERISQEMNKKDHVPDQQQFTQMKEDLSFKEKQTVEAQSTLAHLENGIIFVSYVLRHVIDDEVSNIL